MTETDTHKRKLRSELRALLKTPVPDRAERASRICAQIQALPEWQNARTVALFAPLPSEPAVDALLRDALAGGKCVVLPRICGDSLRWIRVNSEGDRMASTAFADLEEPTGDETVLPCHLDLVLVPGLGFGRGGERLGRGGGYYDRALAAVPFEVARIGVCYDFQIRDHIPQEPHDQKVDKVIVG